MKFISYGIALGLGIAVAVLLNLGLKVRIVDKEPAISVQTGKVNLQTYQKPLIMGDTGIAGFPREKNLWFSDYSHHGKRFSTLFQKEPPYLVESEIQQFQEDLERHLRHIQSYGFNAIEIPGFIELVDFQKIPEIYSSYPEYVERHKAFRKLYSKVIQIAKKYNIQVYFTTDMVSLSKPLVEFLHRKGIGLDVDNQELWDVYSQGVQELFQNFPELAGIMIRIGEAGRIYSQEGWDYWSELLVHTKPAVQTMLKNFLEVASRFHKTIIFRSWAVGIGSVGKMHTVPEVYEEVVGDIQSPNLIVSTKYNRGDFWTYLPLNPTLFTGNQKRIVEFQTRREFEGFTIFPNYVAPHYQQAYRSFLEKNPNITGAWIWSHSGGPLFQSPYMFYLKDGLWLWMDANLYATAQIIQNPNTDIEAITKQWVKKSFGKDPLVVQEIHSLLMESHETVARALTFFPFAKKQAFALGQEIPTVSFCYWNIVGGNSGIFSYLYYLVREELDLVLEEDRKNLEKIKTYLYRFQSIQDKTTLDPETMDLVIQSFQYLENLAATLSSYRKFFLLYFHWMDGRGDSKEWKAALEEFHTYLGEHLRKYQGNLSFPAYNFTEALQLADYGSKSIITLWVARIWIALSIFLGFYILRNPHSFSIEKLQNWILGGIGLLVYLWVTGMVFTSARGFLFTGILCLMGGVYVLFSWYFFHGLRGSVLTLFLPGIVLGIFITIFPALYGGLYFWMQFWISPSIRTIFVIAFTSVALGSYPWLAEAIHRENPHTKPLPSLLMIAGIQIALLGLVLLVFGLNEVVTEINNELVVLPYFLTLIHGITTHLNIPSSLPYAILGLGGCLLVVGWIGRRKKAEI